MMDSFMPTLLKIMAACSALGFGVFGLVSWRERERRAAAVSWGAALLGTLFFWSAAGFPGVIQATVLAAAALIGVGCVVLFFLPIGRVEVRADLPAVRFDEREVIFARARLQPGTPDYESYYRQHPDHREADERARALPGLLSAGAKFADRYQFAASRGSFFLTEALREAVDGPVAADPVARAPEAHTRYVKGLARYFGALDAGVAALRPYHFYSHVGRGTGRYGAPVPAEPGYAVAFTVEMDFEMVAPAPRGPITMESGRQYVEAARVAVQLAQAIRDLGYPARAHIDGNYRVIAPLVARDAGLGEIGRMSILMTPKQGPRVRLGVVTTSLELVPDPREPNQAVLDFCTICKKCALNCPSRSIPFGERQEIDGAYRWRIDPETCYRYWNAVGTDCGRCMAVCPYAHPDHWTHNLVRWGIERSGFFRRAALWLDDLFYGKRPLEKPAPDWTRLA
jgi:ferredoxin